VTGRFADALSYRRWTFDVERAGRIVSRFGNAESISVVRDEGLVGSIRRSRSVIIIRIACWWRAG